MTCIDHMHGPNRSLTNESMSHRVAGRDELYVAEGKIQLRHSHRLYGYNLDYNVKSAHQVKAAEGGQRGRTLGSVSETTRKRALHLSTQTMTTHKSYLEAPLE